jgi:hypothetical protein
VRTVEGVIETVSETYVMVRLVVDRQEMRRLVLKGARVLRPGAQVLVELHMNGETRIVT